MNKIITILFIITLFLISGCSDNGTEWKGPLMPLIEGGTYTFRVNQKELPVCQVTYKITKIGEEFIFGYYSATGKVNNIILMVTVNQEGDDYNFDGHLCNSKSPEYEDGELHGYKVQSSEKFETIVYFKFGTGVYRIEFYEMNNQTSQMELVATDNLINYRTN